jgi:N-acetylglucosaminyl-diphospho-decaprenol L-rhamnosyltransferase
VPKPPKVSVIIPVWNGVEYLSMALSSLEKQTTRDFDVWVVDNGSTDGTVAYLEGDWPDVNVLALPENMGFATAGNRGVEASEGEHVAFVNDDMEFEPDWIERLAEELDRDPSLGIVTSKVLFHDDRSVIYQAGHEYYGYGWCATRGANETDDGQYEERLPTVAGTGAGSMWRRTAFEAVGGFDEEFFMYCEDVDLGLRVMLAGYRGLYVPKPVAYHVGGGKTGKTPEMPRRNFYRNQLVTQVKNIPMPILLRSLPKTILFLHQQYRSERNGGTPRVAVDAYVEFVRRLPRTLRQRRQVLRNRRISTDEFRALLRSDYPFPTESRLGRWIVNRAG